MSHSSLFLQLLILFGSTTLVSTLCHSLRIPTIVGFILTGILIGPHGFGLIDSMSGAQTLSEIGVVLLMFTIGLEFSLNRVRHLGRSFLFLGSAQVFATIGVVGFICYSLTPLGWPPSLFVGCLASLSSTAVVLKLLQDARELETPHGQGIVGVTLFQDLAVIPMVLALPLFEEARAIVAMPSLGGILIWCLQLVIVVSLVGLGARFAVPFLLTRVIKTRSRELFFFSVMFLCFGVAYGAERMGFSLSFGSFVAGVMLAESPYARQATSEVVLMRDNFLGLFFVSVGMLLDVKFAITHIHWVLAICLFLGFAKCTILYLVGRMLRYSHQVAAMVGLILSQVGEFSFILASLGLERHVLQPEEFQYFLSASVVLVGLTPYLYKWAPQVPKLVNAGDIFKGSTVKSQSLKEIEGEVISEFKALKEKDNGKNDPTPHTIIIGYGIAGSNLGSALQALGIHFKVIELNYEVAVRHKKESFDMIFGDATRDEILEQAGIMTSRLVVVLVSGADMMRGVLTAVQRLRPDVRVIVRTLYVRDMTSINLPQNCDCVVSEFETSIEILARALAEYGVSSQRIHEFILRSRKQLTKSSKDFGHMLSRSIEMPTWEALAAIRPVRIPQDAWAVGKSIDETNLRRVTGASVVSVFREYLGTIVPKPDFVFAAGDLVHLIGAPDALEQSEKYFQSGTVSES